MELPVRVDAVAHDAAVASTADRNKLSCSRLGGT
jgi:hypothetical protein